MIGDDVAFSALSQQLASAKARYEAGEFAVAQAEVQSMLARRRANAGQDLSDERVQHLMSRAMVLRLRCFSRRERFDALIDACSELLVFLPADRPTPERADTMIMLSYGQLQVSNPEAALSAAFVALQDGLALDNKSLVSQALDRVSLCYLWMGDGVSAERFMLEAIGFAEQSGDADTRLMRVSNALYLFCTLHDAMHDQADQDGAAALLRRGRRVALSGEPCERDSNNPFLSHMWRANMARWLHRTGQPEAASELRHAVQAEAKLRGWHSIRRPLQLEQALIHEQMGARREAVAELEAMFEPSHTRMRDPQALLVYQRLERLYQALGEQQAAARCREMYEALLVRSLQAVARVQQRLPELAAQISDALADADRQRLQAELLRLREQREAGRGLAAPGHQWHPVPAESD